MSSHSDLPPSMTVLFLFHQMAEQVGGAISSLRPDVTANEISLLLNLGQPKKMKELADLLTCQPSNMTPLVARCVKKGWMQKTRSESDARAMIVELTTDGAALREELIAEISAKITRLSGISDDTFRAILRTLNK